MADAVVFTIKVEPTTSAKTLKTLQGSFLSLHKTGLNMAKGLVSAFKKIGETSYEFVYDSIKHWRNFENIMTVVARTTGMSHEEVFKLGERLREISFKSIEQGGLASGITAERLGEIAGIAGQLGLQASEIEKFSIVIGKMAVATDLSAQSAATLLAQLSNMFGLDIVENIERLGSVINELGNTTVATQSQIAEIMRRMGGTAAFFGLTAAQTAAYAATIREAGITVRVGGTAMSQFMVRLMSDYEKFAETLGLSSFALKQALESNNPSKAIEMVLNKLGELKKFKGKLEVSAMLKELGLTGIGLQDTILKLSGAMDDLRKNLKLSKKEWEESTSLTNEYEKVIGRAGQKFETFWHWVDEIKKLVGVHLTKAFGDFIDNYLTPMLISISHWIKTSPVQRFLKEDIPAALDWIGQKLQLVFDALMKWVVSPQFKKDIADVRKWIRDTIASLDEKFPKIWKNFQRDVEKVWQAAKVLIDLLIEGPGKAKREWDFWKDVWKEFQQGLADTGAKIPWFWDLFIAGYEGFIAAWDLFAETIGAGVEAFKDLGIAAKDAFTAMLGVIGKVVNALGEVSGAILNVVARLIEMAAVGWKKSVFPDMVDWLGLVEKGTLSTKTALAQVGLELASIGKFMGSTSMIDPASWRGIVGAQMNLQQQQFQMRQAQARPAVQAPTAAAPVSAGLGGNTYVTNINLNGEVFATDRNFEDLAKRMGALINEQAERRITA